MSPNITKLLATFFYIGNFPVAPGSLASVAGVFLAIILSPNTVMYAIVMVLMCVIGFITSGNIEKVLNQKDPSCVVIDEVAGALIAFFLLPVYSWSIAITAFFLFRAFDMFKIYPSNEIEKCPGAFGIMMDDIVAGLYTNIIMQIAIRWAGLV